MCASLGCGALSATCTAGAGILGYFLVPWLAIPRSWYRAQKPFKPRKTKKKKKRKIIPHPGSGPETTNKIQKNYEKKGHFGAICVFFLYIFCVFRESLNGGLANGGLRHLSTIAHNCLQLSSFCDESSLKKGAQKATKVHNCRRLCTNCREWP